MDITCITIDSALIQKRVLVKPHIREGKAISGFMSTRNVKIDAIKHEKKASSHFDNYEEDPKSWGLSRKDVDEMLERFYQKNKDSYDHKRDNFTKQDADVIGLELESDYETYNRYLKQLPEGVSAEDVINAYRNKDLPDQILKEKLEKIEIPKKVKAKSKGLAGEPAPPQRLKKEEAAGLWSAANNKRTSKNGDLVDKSRYALFMDHMVNEDLASRIGVSERDLNNKLRSWTGMSVNSVNLQRSLNRNLDTPVTQTGITNSSFLVKKTVSPEFISGFVKKIETNMNSGWATQNGDMLRNYIARSFLGIDTRIKYNDLSFKIENVLKPLGRYVNSEKLIQIRDNNPHTVAHEIGHYLDHKQGEEMGFGDENGASSFMDSINMKMLAERNSDVRVQQMKRFNEFVLNLSDKSQLGSEYLQRRSEVFARFVSKFVDQVNQKAGMRTWGGTHYSDKFNENDYHHFVRLLQEKAYVDIADGNPHGNKVKRDKKRPIKLKG